MISGDAGDGVDIGYPGTATSGNTVEGNYIGTDATGAAPLPNSDSGIVIVDGASNNTIGALGAGNIIAYAPARDAGVEIFSDPPGYTSTGDSIRGNSLFSNGGLAAVVGGGD